MAPTNPPLRRFPAEQITRYDASFERKRNPQWTVSLRLQSETRDEVSVGEGRTQDEARYDALNKLFPVAAPERRRRKQRSA